MYTVPDLIRLVKRKLIRKKLHYFSHHQHIDILIIDTEGYDPPVLDGARSLFLAGLVRVVIFEYHEVGEWHNYKLGDIVMWMNDYDYECFFIHISELWPISGIVLQFMSFYKSYTIYFLCVVKAHVGNPIITF